MRRKLFVAAVVVALILPASVSAHRSAYGVAIEGATVNGDHSVTITWRFESANVFNTSVVVDGFVIRSGSDRATIFTTRPLSAGSHAITIAAREIFETYTGTEPSCMVSGGHYVCSRNWSGSIRVTVPYDTLCVVPGVVGLRLADAKTRIGSARCSMGAVQRVHSNRPAGTVLAQRPRESRRQLPHATTIVLVVSIGPR
jgi:PASTA domain